MKNVPLRSAIAFGLPVLVVFAFSLFKPGSYYFLAAGPLCGIAGGLLLTRRIAAPIVLALCFATIGFMFALEDARSPLFSDVVWTGLVSGFMFWVAGGCAVLALPVRMRFNGASALFVPGVVAGMVFQFLYGPGHFLFDLDARKWWGNWPWEHLLLWLIVAVGGGAALALRSERHRASATVTPITRTNSWALASVISGVAGLAIGALYFVRSALPLGLFNSLSPASAAADWFWGWGVLAAAIAGIAAFIPVRRAWAAAGLALAITLVVVSYRVDAGTTKSQFNVRYAEKLLRENPGSGDAIYTGNLILARTALDNNDVANAKRYLLDAAATPGAQRIEQNGLDTSVVRVLFDRGEKDAVLEYLRRGKTLWPKGEQLISRWEAAIRAGRRPNFNTRGPGGQQPDATPNSR
jgi:hypothetical protein